MALTTYRDIYGWEPGLDYGMSAAGSGGAAAIWTNDGTAHTGCFYGKCLLRPAGGNNCTRLFSPPLVLPVNGTSSFDLKARVYFRIITAPDADASPILDLGNGAAALPIDMYLRLNSNRTWDLNNNFALPTTTTGGAALALNTWYLAVAAMHWERTQDVGDIATCTLTVNGQTLTSGVMSFGNLLFSQPRADRVTLGSITFPGTVGQVDVDDLTVMMQLDSTGHAASVTLPFADRVRLVSITAQGTAADWAGSYTDLQEIPFDPLGPGQISSGAGQTSTFLHAAFAAYTFGAIDVFKVYAHLKATVVGPTTQQIRLNGVNYPVAVSNIYESTVAVQMAVDWSSYVASAFNAAEYGVVNSTGAALTLGGIYAEVLYAPGVTNWTGCNSAAGGVDPNAIPPGCSDGWGIPRPDGLPYVPLLPE